MKAMPINVLAIRAILDFRFNNGLQISGSSVARNSPFNRPQTRKFKEAPCQSPEIPNIIIIFVKSQKAVFFRLRWQYK